MNKLILTFCITLALMMQSLILHTQSVLTIEKIMQGDRFTGFSPENPQWSPSGNNLYFTWTQNIDSVPSLYVFRNDKSLPVKVTPAESKSLPSFNGNYSRDRSKMVYSKNGDIFLLEVKSGNIKQITFTTAIEGNPVFNLKEDKISFTTGNNLFSWDMDSGIFVQLTDLRTGKEKPDEPPFNNERDKWLYNNQLELFTTLAGKKVKSDLARKAGKALEPDRPKVIYTGTGMVRSLKPAPDGNFFTWQSYTPAEEKTTIIPNFVTESGYTEDMRSRSKVGGASSSSGMLYIYDLLRDTMYHINSDDIPGITDVPSFMSENKEDKSGKPKKRDITISDPVWSDDGNNCVVNILSEDNKDRWIMLLDIKTGALRLLDRQHDDAWIGGPGIGYGGLGWLPDNNSIYFQSEETGFSHLYTLDVSTGQKKALTSGNYEIYNLRLSNDKKSWYFISNEVDQCVNELYRMPLNGGPKIRLTLFNGGVEYSLSPDEKYFALRVSHANTPWELYIMENKNKSVPLKITESETPEFKAYNWRIPEFIRFKASDGVFIPARLYKPENQVKGGPAVVFVHGAGYLQNAHMWWSSYSREYMFHNFLVDQGYTVLDLDYRGSAGYGRDWRTAIYRDMGGRDLDDNVDGAKYLVAQQQVGPERIGIYGGSYGGFITLMAMFRAPGIFSAGAALRPVTDWAHYNYGYTSNILNTPVADSIAYRKSSPIYYAEGLDGALLICHGMIDDNVHFQDAVRLVQRLIELGKENWELAVYPVERHGFTEPSSWTDEYKRIFKLFEENLK